MTKKHNTIYSARLPEKHKPINAGRPRQSKSIVINITKKKRNIQLTKCMWKHNKVQINGTTLKTVINNPWGYI